MRCFRLYQRSLKTNKIIKHRDYIGLENLQKFGPETWNRYNNIQYPYSTKPELSENINGKWVKLNEEQTKELLCLKEQ